MKDTDLKEKFIKLHANGVSYDDIAKELNKSRTTLVKWNKELENEIKNLEFLKYQTLLEKHKLTKQAKIEYLTEQIKNVKTAPRGKDYSQLSFRDLIKLLEKLEADLKSETQHVVYHTGEYKEINHFDLDSLVENQEVTLKLY